MKLSKERVFEIKTARENVYSRAVKVLNVEAPAVTNRDVATLFALYDEEFFNGQIAEKVVELSTTPHKYYSTDPEIQFLATRRTSGYGSLSGYYFDRTFDRVTKKYKYQRYFFVDICPNLLDAIFETTQGKGLSEAAGIGCFERFRCFMLVMEHEIVHLLMSLWNYDSTKRQKENSRLFGPHGLLFNCMLETYFGHTQRSHDLALEGVYVPSYDPPRLGFASKDETEVTGVGFSNWSASCYLDSVIMIMLETQTDFWRRSIFNWSVETDELYRFKSKNPGLAEEIKNVLEEDYKAVHEENSEPLECENLRELLSIQDPLMKSEAGSWKMYESGSTYATFAQLFPSLLIDVPVRKIRPSIKQEDSLIYETDAAFTYSDFMIGPTPEAGDDYKKIIWEECQSPILVFTHQAAPQIKVFDSLEDEKQLEYPKLRAFGPRIINNRYKLVGVVVLHGRISKGGGGGHYTCYFLGKDGMWYHYNDTGPTFTFIGDVENLPRDGVWQQSRSELPTMYFYSLIQKQKPDLKKEPRLPTPTKAIKFQPEKKEGVRGTYVDYVRVDRPDHGVIFIVVFKNPERKMEIIKGIRDALETTDSSVTETKMDENKIAWRVPSAKLGNKLQNVLQKLETSSDVVPKISKKQESQAQKPTPGSVAVIGRNKNFTVYDYSDKSIAVTGSGGSPRYATESLPLEEYAEELRKLGLESINLKYDLGRGFIISKTKLSKLKKLIGI